MMARQDKLEGLGTYLKPLRRRPSADDGIAAVAALLDKKIERQKRSERGK